MYSMLYSLPPKHNLTFCVRGANNKENFDICIEAPMTSSIYKCEAEGRPHTTRMEAVLDESHGTFSLVLTVKPNFRLRDLFSPQGGAKQTIAAAVSLKQAQKALADFEARCTEEKLPVAEGPNRLASHYSFVKELRRHDPVTTPTFPSATAILEKLKPR